LQIKTTQVAEHTRTEKYVKRHPKWITIK